MPSWPARFLHTSSTPNPSPSIEAGTSRRSMKSESDVNPPAPEPSPVDISPSRTLHQSPRHGRSHSHPLSTLLAIKRKNTDNRDDARDHTGDLISSAMTNPNMNTISGVFPNGEKSKINDKELVSGRCKTCDSAVRWPDHLNVFRCTICLMVNDLRPSKVRSRQQLGIQEAENRMPPNKSLILELTECFSFDDLSQDDREDDQ